MSAIDVLSVAEADAKHTLRRRLAELATLTETADHCVAQDREPPCHALAMKAAAVGEATQIWQAQRDALDMAMAKARRPA